jgi:hypothetical protein
MEMASKHLKARPLTADERRGLTNGEQFVKFCRLHGFTSEREVVTACSATSLMEVHDHEWKELIRKNQAE